MTEKTLGAEAVVREGEEAFAGRRDLVEEHGALPCFVRHPDAGGLCKRPAVMQVYGLPFCEIHGAEAKAGALEELYHDAANFLQRPDNPHVPGPNPAALRALREAASELRGAEVAASREEGVLRRAYPVIPGRVDEETLHFDHHDPESVSESPVDWGYRERMLIHKLMRVAHEDGSAHYLVEALEEHREHVSAQLAFALADYDKRAGKPTSK